MRHSICSFACLVMVMLSAAQQPDTLRLTLEQAEERFLNRNLLLLAQRYQIDAVKANEIQEKLYDNPSLSAELATYSPETKWFDVGRNGQKQFSLDQLITLAGKRNKRVNLAREQTNESSLALYDLLRTLKYQLRLDFYTAAYVMEIIEKYDDQIRLLQHIIASYDEQSVKRNVSLKDAIRLKAEAIQLRADRNGFMMNYISSLQNLRLLLDTTAVILPLKDDSPQRLPPDITTLIELAKLNRTDLRIQESQLKQEELNHRLQKALATPDLMVGLAYDQLGSYTPHLYSLRASIDLPFFNRNQGNIRAAGSRILSSKVLLDYKQGEVEKEVLGSLQRLEEAEQEYNLSRQLFQNNFPEVNVAVIENFNKGNINILEFMDFFENYNSAIRQLNELQRQRRLAWEELEFTVGTVLPGN